MRGKGAAATCRGKAARSAGLAARTPRNHHPFGRHVDCTRELPSERLEPVSSAPEGVLMFRSGLDEYIGSLRGVVPLDLESEQALAKAFRAGDRRAGDQLVSACL